MLVYAKRASSLGVWVVFVQIDLRSVNPQLWWVPSYHRAGPCSGVHGTRRSRSIVFYCIAQVRFCLPWRALVLHLQPPLQQEHGKRERCFLNQPILFLFPSEPPISFLDAHAHQTNEHAAPQRLGRLELDRAP